MSEIDYEKLSTMIAGKITQLTLTRSEVEIRLGFAPDSTAAREVMKDPQFPKPDYFSDRGRARWYARDIDDYINKKRHERAKMAISVA